MDAIWEIDPLRGEALGELNKMAIYPGQPLCDDPGELKRAVEDIGVELEERLQKLMREGKLLEAQRLAQRTHFDLEMLQEMGFCHGIENYSRHLDGRQAGQPPWVVCSTISPMITCSVSTKVHVTVPQIGGMYRGDRARKKYVGRLWLPLALCPRQSAPEFRGVRGSWCIR